MKKESQRDAIRDMNATVNYVSRKAKLDASEQQSGLMPANLYRGAKARFEHAKVMTPGTDIFTLSPGFYEISNPQNVDVQENPGNFWIEIDKAERGNIRYRALSTYSGKEYELVKNVTNLGANVSAVWTSQSQEAILWSGSAVGTGTELTLSDRVQRFRILKISILVANTDYTLEISRNDVPTAQYVPTSFSVVFDNYVKNPTQNLVYKYRLDFTRPDQTTLKIDAVKVILYDLDKMTATVQPDSGYQITRIVGVK